MMTFFPSVYASQDSNTICYAANAQSVCYFLIYDQHPFSPTQCENTRVIIIFRPTPYLLEAESVNREKQK